MLSDFDLSLRCVVSPTLVKSLRTKSGPKNSGYCVKSAGLVQSVFLQPICFSPAFLSGKPKKDTKPRSKNEIHQVINLPELLAEPTNARSNSFVGTHDYLAPEIIRGEGHGSSVDWWTFGIFLYELLFGRTPFKGQGSRATLFNVVGQPLKFPETPNVSFAAKDLISGLLAKEPRHRIAHRCGATEVKQHPFYKALTGRSFVAPNQTFQFLQAAAISIPSGSKAPKLPVKNAKPALDLQASGISRDGLLPRQSEILGHALKNLLVFLNS